MQDDAKLTRLDDRALDTVSGGHLAKYLAKGVAVGALVVAPAIVPSLIGAKDSQSATIATAGLSWGALAGWAGHIALRYL